MEAGVPVYYMGDTLGRGIVREMPDGTRHLIEVDDGNEIVVQTLAPR